MSSFNQKKKPHQNKCRNNHLKVAIFPSIKNYNQEIIESGDNETSAEVTLRG